MAKKINELTESTNLTNILEKKKKYSNPTLIQMGSMQTITLGGSQFPGDSGQNPPLVNN